MATKKGTKGTAAKRNLMRDTLNGGLSAQEETARLFGKNMLETMLDGLRDGDAIACLADELVAKEVPDAHLELVVARASELAARFLAGHMRNLVAEYREGK